MTATEPSAGAASADSPAARDAGDTSLTDIAQHTAQYAQAWGALLISEAALAKVNLVRLLILALIVPALALGVIVGVDTLLAGLVQRWLQDWSLAIAGVLLLNVAALFGALLLLRAWWRSLSLPRSRAALSRLVKGMP